MARWARVSRSTLVTGSRAAISARTAEAPKRCVDCRNGSTSAATLRRPRSTPTATRAVIVGSFAALTTRSLRDDWVGLDRCANFRACPRILPTTLLLANRRTEFHDAALAAVVDH